MVLAKAKRDELLTPLSAVSGIIERRHTLPILSNVLIEQAGTNLAFLATDIEIQITARTPLQASGDIAVIALWLGHEPIQTTQVYLHAHIALKVAALAKLKPDYRYRTNILADGEIDFGSRTLEGDLVIEGGADPMFSSYDAQEVAVQLSRLGIARVIGNLRIAGPFYYFATGYHSNLSPETSASKLRVAFQHAGIRIDGSIALAKRPALSCFHIIRTLWSLYFSIRMLTAVMQ